MYAFSPETQGLEPEDVNHIFEKGDITGDVWASHGGRTEQRWQIAQDVAARETKPRGDGSDVVVW